MSTRPSAELRREIVARADNRCEYCLIHQEDSVATHQIDHVVAEKHGGATVTKNLALSCLPCNARKGSDIGSFDPATGLVTLLFNPRSQIWTEHFRFDETRIEGQTPEGRTTVVFLQFNSYERMTERRELLAAGRLPHFS